MPFRSLQRLGAVLAVGVAATVPGASAAAVASPTGAGWAVLSTGFGHTCGIRLDGTMWCWGLNAQGQLGDQTCTNQSRRPGSGNGHGLDRVTAGSHHTCGISRPARSGAGATTATGSSAPVTRATGTFRPSSAPAGLGRPSAPAPTTPVPSRWTPPSGAGGTSAEAAPGGRSAGGTLYPVQVGRATAWASSARRTRTRAARGSTAPVVLGRGRQGPAGARPGGEEAADLPRSGTDTDWASSAPATTTPAPPR